MNKEKKNNRPLILSIITLMICIALLIGATMAWFTDTETNTGNRIQAGTLDVELWVWATPIGTESGTIPSTVVSTENGWIQITDESNPNTIFGKLFDNWAPNDEQTIYVAVVNNGTLALDYTIDLVITDDELADALQFSSATAAAAGNIPTVSTDYVTISSKIVDDAISATGDAPNELAGKTIDFAAISIKLDESTEKTYQGKEFVMDLILTATQEEQDDTIVKAYDIEDITSLTIADADKTVVLMKDIESDKEVTIPTNVNIDLNGYTLTVKSFSMTNETDYCTVDIANGTIVATDEATGVSVLIPKGTVNVENGTIASNGQIIFNASSSTLNLTGTTQFVTLDEENEPTSTEKSITILADTRVVVDTEENVILNVEENTSGVEVENAESNIGTTTVQGDGAGSVVVDDTDDTITVNAPWDGVTLTEPTWYYWKNDIDDDYSLYAKPANSAWATVFEVGTAEELAWISAFEAGVIANADSGTGASGLDYCKVILTADIDLGGYEWTPIGGGTSPTIYCVFDGQGHTVSNFTINSSLAYRIGFFGYLQNSTIRDLTLDNVTVTKSSASSCIGIAVGLAGSGTVLDNVDVYNSTLTTTGTGSSYTTTATCNSGAGCIVGAAMSTTSLNKTVTISNCDTDATITSNYFGVGGIVGYATRQISSYGPIELTITNCTTTGITTVCGGSYSGSTVTIN